MKKQQEGEGPGGQWWRVRKGEELASFLIKKRATREDHSSIDLHRVSCYYSESADSNLDLSPQILICSTSLLTWHTVFTIPISHHTSTVRGKGKGYRGKGRGRGGPPRRGDKEDDSDSDGIEYVRTGGGQPATAGMMPPTDSEDESDSGEEEKEEKVPKGQNPRVGLMPPSDSDDDDNDGSASSSSSEPPMPARAPREAPRRKKEEDDVDPEQMRKDMERLALVRQRREEERLKRIQEEGYDRYAAPPPAVLPKDHPTAGA